MTSTLLLDRTAWDLALDAAGNIALATEPYSYAQDVASSCRTFLGEVYYDTTRGVRYLADLPVAALKEQLVAAARLVPDVTTAAVYLTDVGERTVAGQVQFTLASGGEGIAAL